MNTKFTESAGFFHQYLPQQIKTSYTNTTVTKFALVFSKPNIKTM